MKTPEGAFRELRNSLKNRDATQLRQLFQGYAIIVGGWYRISHRSFCARGYRFILEVKKPYGDIREVNDADAESCTCVDFKLKQDEGAPCKHVWAVRLLEEMGEGDKDHYYEQYLVSYYRIIPKPTMLP